MERFIYNTIVMANSVYRLNKLNYVGLAFALILFASPLAFANDIVVGLATADALNTSSQTITFNFTILNQTGVVGTGFAKNITNASIWIANSSPLAGGIPAIIWGANQTVNTTTLQVVAAGGNLISVGGLPFGSYVWNANVTTGDESNFSASNRTFTVDQQGVTVNRVVLTDQGAQLQNFGMQKNMTVPVPIAGRMAKPITNFTTFLVNVTTPGTGVMGVQVTNVTAANGNPGAAVSGTLFNGSVRNGVWSITLNITNATDGFANFTLNVTTYSGVSYVVNITGKNQVLNELYGDASKYSQFSFAPNFGAEYFVNNYPAISGRVLDMRNGNPLILSPTQYNVTVYAEKVSFGQATTAYSQQFPVDANGNFIISFNDSAAIPSFGGQFQGGFGGAPAMYRFYVLVNGSNGNVTLASAYSMPQPVGFMAPPGRPGSGRNLFAAPSETILLGAQNATGQCTNFWGMVMDTTSGVPIRFIENASASGPCTTAAWQPIYLPANKNVSIVIMNPPFNGGSTFPPRTVAVTTQNLSDSDTTDFNGVALNVTVNTSFTTVNLNGSLIVNNGTLATPGPVIANTTTMAPGVFVNYTKLEAYMSFSGFIPPMQPASSRNASTLQATGNYSLTLISGVTYTVFVYATDNSTTPGNYMGVVTVTPPTSLPQNITLYRLAGTYPTTPGGSFGGMQGSDASGSQQGGLDQGSSGGFNTSATAIRFVNENGSLVSDTSNPTANQQSAGDIQGEIFTNYSGTVIRRMVRAQGQATASIPLLQGEPFRIRIYAQGYIPMDRTITGALVTANSTLNITLKTPEMRPPHSNGVENNSFISTMRMEFLTSNSTCNAPNFPASCKASFLKQEGGNASHFDSNANQMTGVQNILITETTSNTATFMVGVDLSSFSTPNMEMDSSNFEDRTQGANKVQTKRFGSYLPPGVASALWVAQAVNRSAINMSSVDGGNLSQVSMSIPYLYDDDGNLQWNVSTNTSAQIPSKYQDYPPAFSGQASNASYLSGIYCWFNFNTSIVCWADQVNNVTWLKIPHFSQVGVTQTGAAAAAATSTDTTVAASNTGSGGSSGGSGGVPSAAATASAAASASAQAIVVADSSVTVTGNVVTASLPALSSSTASQVTINVPATAFTGVSASVSGISLNVPAGSNAATVSVTSLGTTLPPGLPALPSSTVGQTLVFVDIKASAADSTAAAITSATVTFTASAASGQEGNVRLMHLQAGQWITLQTTWLGGNQYTAVTTSFSPFAVVVTKPAPSAAPAATAQPSAKPPQATAAPTQAPAAATASNSGVEPSTILELAAGVLILAGLYYFYGRGKKE